MPAPSDPATTPRHVAIVMDGNGRWAERRRRPRSFGHSAGQKAVRRTVEFCLRSEISALTLFAFSSENWQRPKREVKALLQLFVKALDKETAELHERGAQVRFVGDLEAFDKPLRERMRSTMRITQGNTALVLNVAVNYGGRWDLAQAARKLAQSVARGEMAAEDIDEHCLDAHVCLAGLPPPDLLIRTGGDCRISNFLLWQLAYTELYFTDTLWPDVDADCLAAALAEYAHRQRRFGRTGKQVRALAAVPH